MGLITYHSLSSALAGGGRTALRRTHTRAQVLAVGAAKLHEHERLRPR
jgi:hypothetical protein